MVLHLSQAGRLDIEEPPKKTKPRGAVARFTFTTAASASTVGVLVREYGTQRKASWWVLAPGRRGTAGRPGARAGQRRVRRLHPHQRLAAPPHHRPARPARGVGHRPRLGRRHPAPGQAVALRLAALAEPGPARGPAHRRHRRPGRGARARARPRGRPVRGQAGRPLQGARPRRRALPDAVRRHAAPGVRSSPTRWRTARRARRAARCWPTAASPACSSEPRSRLSSAGAPR